MKENLLSSDLSHVLDSSWCDVHLARCLKICPDSLPYFLGPFARIQEIGDDYIDAALFFAERIKQDAARFREEVEKLDIPVTVITQADCIPDHYKNDINGKIIAINPAILKPEYQRADRQLFLVTGGFGASANARGSAVFCKNLYDGKNTRYERMDVLGEIKPERMPDWAKEKAAAFSRTIQGKDHER